MSETAYERLIGALKAQGLTVDANGTRAMAQCPAHDDRNPSFSITDRDDRVLIHCFAGCEPGDILSAIDWTTADLFNNRTGANYLYPDGRIVHRTYDENGKKKIRQSGDTSGCPQLYRLDKVTEAVKAGDPIYLVEGEEDVHTLESLGVTATTAPQGGPNFHLVDVSPLEDAHVIAIFDRDSTGKKWALKVRERLDGYASKLEFRKAKTGKDTTDHVAAGHSLDELVDVPTDKAAPVELGSWAPVDMGPVVRGEFQAVEPTIGERNDGVPLIYPGKEHSLGAETEAGKTWFACMVCAQELTKGNPVTYIDFEDDEGSVGSRLMALGVPGDVLTNPKLFRYVRPETAVNEKALAALLDNNPVLVVLDGMTEAFGLHGWQIKENDHAALFRQALVKPVLRTGAATLTLDHVVKAKDSQGRYNIGGVHKLNGLTGAGFKLVNLEPFGVGRKGVSQLLITKDRPGHLRKNGIPTKEAGITYFGLLVGDATGVESPLDETPEMVLGLFPARETKKRENEIKDRILEVLREIGEIGYTIPELRGKISGDNNLISATVKELVKDELVRQIKRDRARPYVLAEFAPDGGVTP